MVIKKNDEDLGSFLARTLKLDEDEYLLRYEKNGHDFDFVSYKKQLLIKENDLTRRINYYYKHSGMNKLNEKPLMFIGNGKSVVVNFLKEKATNSVYSIRIRELDYTLN